MTHRSHIKVNANTAITQMLILLVMLSFSVFGQKAEVVPIEKLMEREVRLKPENAGKHPRLFFGSEDIAGLRAKAKGPGAGLWKEVLDEVASFRDQVPDVEDEDLYKSGLAERKKGTMTQYSLAFRISQTTFAYLIESDSKYLEQSKKLIFAACRMPFWGYASNKPNVDLPPANLLYAVAFAYDILHEKLTEAERKLIREKLTLQGRLMYEYFKYKPKKRYTYSQNHTWIPMAGLAIAAYALMDEVDEAKEWAKLARAVYDRTMQTFASDGYFYESFLYYGFAFRWMVRYFDAHLRATGENLYLPMKPKLDGMKYFAMHSVLPDGENVFDFADIGDGSLNRNGTSKREPIYGEHDIMYRLAAVYRDPAAQTAGEFVHHKTKIKTREPMWAFINYDPELKAMPLSEFPLWHHFRDNDTVFWRSSWDKNATAFAFRSAPPEGHAAAKLAGQIPDWRQNNGHAHTDANSFIIWANGKYLTGDTGYLGIKQTDDHNTILINGRGQENEGVYEAFKGVSNEQLDRIRIAEVGSGKDFFYVRGDAAAAYPAGLGLKRFDRHFLYLKKGYFIVWDELETAEPAEFTFMLNADREIRISDGITQLINVDAALRVVRILPSETENVAVPQIVQARGLPGSVDKGDSEQRGMQLRSTAKAKTGKFEFLHFLQPVKVGLEESPKVEPTAEGVRVRWPNGETETINLRTKERSIETSRQSVSAK